MRKQTSAFFMSYKDWRYRWKTSCLEDLYSETSVFVEHQTEDVGRNVGPETPSTEFKYPTVLNCSDGDITVYSTAKTEQLFSLANVSGNDYFEFVVGVSEEDNVSKDGIYIGIVIEEFPEESYLDICSNLFPACFPCLKGEWRVTRIVLNNSSPEDWNECTEVVTIDGLDNNTIITLLKGLKGKAAWENSETGEFKLIAPSSSRNALETLLSTEQKESIQQEDKEYYTNLPRRVVLSFRFYHNSNYPLAYVPVKQKSGGLYPFSIWLRWREQRLSHAVQRDFRSCDVCTFLLFSDSSQYNSSMFQETLQPLLSCSCATFTVVNPKSEDFNAIAEKSFLFSRGLLFVTFEDFEQLIVAFREGFNQFHSCSRIHFNVILLIPLSSLCNNLWGKYKNYLKVTSLFPEYHIIDICLFDPLNVAIVPTYSERFRHTSPEQIERLSAEQLQRNFVNWMLKPGVDASFAISAGIVCTSAVQHIIDCICDQHGSGSKWIPLYKYYPGSGASSTLIAIGTQLHASHSVHLLHEFSQNDVDTFLEHCLQQSTKNMLLLIDDNIDSKPVRKVATTLGQKVNRLIIVVSVENVDTNSKPGTISPFLESQGDVELFRVNLSKFFPERQSQLSKAAEYCTFSGASKYDRHFYVFCLVATTGKWVPPLEWIDSLVLKMKKDDDLYKLVLALAFISVFGNPIITVNQLAVIYRDVPEYFYELFYISGDKVHCKHSFFAKILLITYVNRNCTSMDNMFLNPENLNNLWKDLAMDYLNTRLQPRDFKQLVNDILLSRPSKSIHFSSFVSGILSNPYENKSSTNESIFKMRYNLLDSIFNSTSQKCPTLRDYLTLAMSRCCRYLCQDSNFSAKVIATTASTKAFNLYQKNPSDLMMLQNAACMAAVLAKSKPTKPKLWSNADNLFEKYYRNTDDKNEAAQTAFNNLKSGLTLDLEKWKERIDTSITEDQIEVIKYDWWHVQ